MKIRILCVSILFLVCAVFRSDSTVASPENLQKRIRFQVTAIGESSNESKVLAQTTIEGLPGTDFNINLNAGNFKMQARFLSDLVADDKLKILARFETRRFYGYSPINLPLYEEDNQKQRLELGFNETIVLLPFGRNGGAETLKIEIIPTLLYVEKNEKSSALTINFKKQVPNGEIFIEASKIPHKFDVEATLLADGRPIARGRGECLLEEAKEIILSPISNDELTNRPFKTSLTINKFIRNGEQGLVDINFDFFRTGWDSGAANEAIISGGAGVGLLGGDHLSYPLKNPGLSGQTNYELRFRILLGEGESQNSS